jgi:holo-[acyl-carrier protein] synthase
MKILGIGLDLVETHRIEESIQRFGERFLRRVYLPGEIEYCAQMAIPSVHYAARFAAKEAISKAFGTGIGSALGWQDMEIARRDSGAPYVILHGRGARHAETLGVTEVLVSLSHTRSHGAAQAIVIA